MCLILFSVNTHPDYPLILISNRDEFHERPTETLKWWNDQPEILAGRDLQGGGTWMGINKSGKIAAITNYRQFPIEKSYESTRGELVKNFLTKESSPEEYLQELRATSDQYDGYNLLFGNRDQLYYFSNRSDKYGKIEPGVHGLSNELLNTPWPKVESGKHEFGSLIDQKDVEPTKFMRILSNKERANESELPDTGIGKDKEIMLSSIFIESNNYGTRASNVLLLNQKGEVTFIEKSHIPDDHNEYQFTID